MGRIYCLPAERYFEAHAPKITEARVVLLRPAGLNLMPTTFTRHLVFSTDLSRRKMQHTKGEQNEDDGQNTVAQMGLTMLRRRVVALHTVDFRREKVERGTRRGKELSFLPSSCWLRRVASSRYLGPC